MRCATLLLLGTVRPYSVFCSLWPLRPVPSAPLDYRPASFDPRRDSTVRINVQHYGWNLSEYTIGDIVVVVIIVVATSSQDVLRS
jgi:hypothetical protein